MSRRSWTDGPVVSVSHETTGPDPELVELTPQNLAAVKGPRPVAAWEDSEEAWLSYRREGLGGSDVLAALGFSAYTSPWEVWREKTSQISIDTEPPSEAARLGNDLEPWLLDQAPDLLGEAAYRTLHRTYAHPDHWWRRCSPDGVLADGRLVECKTAGLASGFGTPPGWADGRVPLGYEFQVRWGLHVMDSPAAEIIALVAGLGLIRRTVTRDMGIEAKLVRQVAAWWGRHVTEGVEPPLSAGDAALIEAMYPTPEVETVALDETDAVAHWESYLDARSREKAAAAEKNAAAAELKALIGDAECGTVEGYTIASWGLKKGQVSYKTYAADLAELLTDAGLEAPDPEDYRGAPGRSFNVKEFQ